MSDSNLEKVQAAGLLSSLAGLFFRGIDNALSEISEYEEEMGVLKQINKIPIESLDGDRKYTLTIKLSPIRGKDSVYYVEAETDAPNLDVSKLDGKTVSINKDNAREFRKMVDKLISSSNYAAKMKRDADEDDNQDADDDNQDESTSKKRNSKSELSKEGQLKDVVDSVEEWFQENAAIIMGNGLVVNIVVEFTNLTSDGLAEVELSAVDALQNKGQSIKNISPKVITLQLIDKDDNVISAESLIVMIKDHIKEYVSHYKLDANNIKYVKSNSTVLATFIKDKEGIGLTAIRASNDIDNSMRIVNGLMDSEDFVNSLEDGDEKSFEITESSEDYDIEEIGNFETIDSYLILYRETSRIYIMMKSLESMIGLKAWQADNFFNNLYLDIVQIQTLFSTWLVDNVDILPILQDPFELVPSFADYANYTDNSMIPSIKSKLNHDVARLLDIIEFLSVNITADQQSQLDSLVSCLQDDLN